LTLVADSPKAGTDTTAKLVDLLPLLGGTAGVLLMHCYRQRLTYSAAACPEFLPGLPSWNVANKQPRSGKAFDYMVISGRLSSRNTE